MESGGSTDPAKGSQSNQARGINLWESLVRLGLGEQVLRIGTVLSSLTLIILVIWVMRTFYLNTDNPSAFQSAFPFTTTRTPRLVPPAFNQPASTSLSDGITRLANVHTILPDRPRFEVITYQVVSGDTIFGIAEKYGLYPETILWGNLQTLGDNPELILEGTVLNILPLDGVYHQWSAGEGLNGIAEYYGVPVEDILDWPGNHLDEATLGDYSNPKIEPGTMLVIPGGRREFYNWTSPFISRTEPITARTLGPGYCDGVYSGVVGTGVFIYPTTAHMLSGYDWSPSTNHTGLDFDGEIGSPVYASDTGVVVYAGWHNHGYGNLVVLDHGNGWQTYYAHLSAYYVSCGLSVYQGAVIGDVGSTGQSTGPHLHFELTSETLGDVNPWDYLQE